MENIDHSQRILEAIKQGFTRRSQLVKQTCLDPSAVAAALTKLRKSKRVKKSADGQYRAI
jgi:hypothetical protein